MIADSSEIKFECSQCGQSILVDISGAGVHTNCPTCDNPLIVPSPSALHDREYGKSAASSAGRAGFSREDAAHAAAEVRELHEARAEALRRGEEAAQVLAEARQESARLEQRAATAEAQHADARAKLSDFGARLAAVEENRAQWEQAFAQTTEQASAAGTQMAAREAELRAARDEARNESAGLERRATAAEAQLADARTIITDLGARLAVAEENRAHWEQAFAQTTEQASAAGTQMAARESELNAAHAEARGEIDALTAAHTAECTALRSQIESAQTEAHAAAIVADEKLAATQRALETAESARDSIAGRAAALRTEADTLRADLSEIHTGRELISLRDRFQALDTEHQRAIAALARSTAEVQMLTLSSEKIRAELIETRNRAADAEHRADAASETALKRDNDVLRGIIERQNSVGEERYAELRKLRRARLTLRILYALVILALIGFAFIAIDYLPDAVKQFLHDWFGIQ